MVCACAEGSWSSGKVSTNETDIAKVSEFLGMRSKYSDDDSTGFYPNPKVTDSGVTSSANWASTAATLVAAYNTAAAISISNKQYDIAKSYYQIAYQKWERFNQKYMPCEKAEMNEACNTPEYIIPYDGQAADVSNEVTQDYGQMRSRLGQYYNLYCICADDSLLRDFAIAQDQMVVDSVNYIWRFEEYRKISKDDTRWNRRAQALNRGRNLESESVSFAKAAANIYGHLGQEIGQATEGAMSFLGYFSRRNSTIYPQGRTGQPPSPAMTGGSFIGATPQNGEFGFVSNTPNQLVNEDWGITYNYLNDSTPFSQNRGVTSVAGAQQPSSSGG